jgi:hypothetical protein
MKVTSAADCSPLFSYWVFSVVMWKGKCNTFSIVRNRFHILGTPRMFAFCRCEHLAWSIPMALLSQPSLDKIWKTRSTRKGSIQWTHPPTQDHRQGARQDIKQDRAHGQRKTGWDVNFVSVDMSYLHGIQSKIDKRVREVLLNAK